MLDTILPHAALIAVEEHLVHLFMIIFSQCLILSSEPGLAHQAVFFKPQMLPADPRAPCSIDPSPTQCPCTWSLQPSFPLPFDKPQPSLLAPLPATPS